MPPRAGRGVGNCGLKRIADDPPSDAVRAPRNTRKSHIFGTDAGVAFPRVTSVRVTNRRRAHRTVGPRGPRSGAVEVLREQRQLLAQTAERHANVTVPARSETGVGLGGDARRRPPARHAWTRARSWPARASRCTGSSAAASGRGRQAPHATRLLRRAGPPRPSMSDDARLRGTGHVLGLRGRDHGLAAGAQQLDEALAAVGVELGHHVVEQHQRRPAALVARGRRARRSRSASSAGRCWPCEPYARSARPACGARGRRGAARAP